MLKIPRASLLSALARTSCSVLTRALGDRAEPIRAVAVPDALAVENILGSAGPNDENLEAVQLGGARGDRSARRPARRSARRAFAVCGPRCSASDAPAG